MGAWDDGASENDLALDLIDGVRRGGVGGDPADAPLDDAPHSDFRYSADDEALVAHDAQLAEHTRS